jgi:hypothetical protein
VLRHVSRYDINKELTAIHSFIAKTAIMLYKVCYFCHKTLNTLMYKQKKLYNYSFKFKFVKCANSFYTQFLLRKSYTVLNLWGIKFTLSHYYNCLWLSFICANIISLNVCYCSAFLNFSKQHLSFCNLHAGISII